ncbi:MAG: AsmA family protein [Stappiaceae bacterium]
MNSLYITIGISLIVALIVALIGPFFIDWTSYRSTFEDYAEKVLGQPVTVLGDADVRLLPSPRLTFTDVRVGTAEDPLMEVSSFQVVAELPPLLKGELRVQEMLLQHPVLRLGLDESGRLDWFTERLGRKTETLDPDSVLLNDIQIVNGALKITDARTGAIYAVDKINVVGSARSLNGPFRGDGALSIGQTPHTISFATGRTKSDGDILVKAQVNPASEPVSWNFNGDLSHSDGVPEFDGSFSLATIVPEEETEDTFTKIWNGRGAVVMNSDGITFDNVDVRYGPQDKSIHLLGSAKAKFGVEPKFEARLQSKQIDLDRLMGRGPQNPVSTQDAVDELIGGIENLPVTSIPGTVSFDLPGLVVNGNIIQEIEIAASSLPRGWAIQRVAAKLPGRSQLLTDGELNLRGAVYYKGDFRIESQQPAAFVNWWQDSKSGNALVLDPITLDMRMELGTAGLVVSRINGQLGSDRLSGSASWKPKLGDSRPEYAADLDAETLTLDQIQAVSRLLFTSRSQNTADEEKTGDAMTADIGLRLHADRLDLNGVMASSIDVSVNYRDGLLEIDRFGAEDLAGAKIEASGSVRDLESAPDGQINALIEAEDMTGALTMLGGLFPDNPAIARMALDANAFSPARLEANFSGQAIAGQSTTKLQITGTMDDTKVDAGLNFHGNFARWSQGDTNIDIQMAAEKGPQLLRQLGFDVLPVDNVGSAALSAKLEGRPGEGLDATFSLLAADTDMSAAGKLTWLEDRDPIYDFDLSLRSPDLSPLALLTGRLLPMVATDAPVNLVARLVGEGSAFQLDGLRGTFAGIGAEGRLSGKISAGNPNITGDLNVSETDFRAVTELVLGPDVWSSLEGINGSETDTQVSPNGPWPSGIFGPPILNAGQIQLNIGTERLVFDKNYIARKASFKMTLKPSTLAFDGLSADFSGGKLTGNLLIQRTSGEASISGNAKLADIALEDLVWRSEGRPVSTGTLDATADFESVGRSVAGLVSGLTGGGTFSINDGEVRGISPQAFGLVTRAVDAGLELESDKIREAFSSHLDASSFPFKSVNGNIAIAAGQARARNVNVESDSASATGAALIDLEDWKIDSNWTVKVDLIDDAVTGAEPQVGLVFKGSMDNPVRSIDISQFTSYLTLRAFEIEVRKVERLQSEILERERMTREMKQFKRDETKRELARERAAQRAAEAERRRNNPDPISETPNAPEEQTESTDNALPLSPIPENDTTFGADQEPSSAATPPVDGETPELANQIRDLLDRLPADDPVTTNSIPVTPQNLIVEEDPAGGLIATDPDENPALNLQKLIVRPKPPIPETAVRRTSRPLRLRTQVPRKRVPKFILNRNGRLVVNPEYQ